MDFKGLGSFGEIFQQATKLRDEMQRVQGMLAQKTVEASAGAGMVKAMANGRQEIVSVTLDPEMVKMNDKKLIEDLVVAACNQAIRASQEMAAEEMKKVTGGLGLGSLLSMFNKGS